MVTGIKKAVFKLIDKALAQNGIVLGVREWMPGSIYEIELHLPGIDMNKWTTIPRLKIKVEDPGQYRDYTPARWDATERTCTLLIETRHTGSGSLWAKNLRVGDTVLCGAAHAAGLPARPGRIACLGDGSAIGHFTALKQLTEKTACSFQAAIFLNEDCEIPADFTRDNPEFEFIAHENVNSLDALRSFYQGSAWSEPDYIYIAGYIPMVSGLRKYFKNTDGLNARIFAHGFWS